MLQVKIEDKSKECVLPKVAHLWMHDNDCESIYLRIEDAAGQRGFPNYNIKERFFSVCLGNGKIYATYRDSHNIILLQPIGGILHLERV